MKVNHEKQIARLVDLVGRLEALTENKIEPEVLHSAKSFLLNLPKTHETPKVAPDGEGGIIFAWEVGKTVRILSVDSLCLHLVIINKGQSTSYLEDIDYEEGKIPELILDNLPRKGI